MAKFRRKVRRAFAKTKSAYRASSRPSISAIDVMLAGAVYGGVRPTIANFTPDLFKFGPVDSDNVIFAGLGYWASRQKSKFIKALGLVAMGTEAGIMTSRVVAPVVQDSMDPSMVQTY